MYTLSSPTVLATDAAAHPAAAQVLRSLSDVFRLTPDGAAALAQAWPGRDPQAMGIAWGMVGLLDLNAPALPDALRAAAAGVRSGLLVDAEDLAGSRFGGAARVAALVAAEACAWPDAPVADLPHAGRVPASAAVAAAAVAAHWAGPDLGREHVRALRAPFNQAWVSGARLFQTGRATYGRRGAAVLELLDQVRTQEIKAEQLAEVRWPGGVWSRAMHEAAWACLRHGRLLAQMRATLDVTLEFVSSNPLLSAVQVRGCLPALHAMTVYRLVLDIAEEHTLDELALAEWAY